MQAAATMERENWRPGPPSQPAERRRYNLKLETRNSKLILASASPRRAELLRNAEIPFLAEPAHLVEVRGDHESPEQYVRRLAREKAQTVFARHPSEFVLGADTEVVLDGAVLGKPRDVADAVRMLRLLSARTHLVMTAICLLGPGVEDSQIETTTVTFGNVANQDVEDYAASGETLDKAGGYAIQGMASRWITRIEGCYFNVVGLPVPLVYRLLREHGAI
jgi:septum formation protein